MMKKPPITLKEKRRALGIATFIFFLFSLLIAQFFNIQILEGEKWLQVAHRQHYFIVKEPFKRGTFYSNGNVKKGHPGESQRFVIDIPKFHLYTDPVSIPAALRDEVSDNIIARLELSIDERMNLRKQLSKKSRSRKLAMWLDEDMYKGLKQWWQGYARQHKIPRNALFFVKDYQRSYPFGKLLGQVLHTIQNQKDGDQALPTGGLELYFNKYLRGKAGKSRLMRSPRNSLEIGEIISYPEDGADIYLTINPVLQAIAEDEIEKGVKKCKAKSGWAAMINPYTGELLAVAQYPFFNPQDYQFYFNDPQLIENTKVKAVTDANEPGSVFKPLTAALALTANEELKARGEKELFQPEGKIATASGRFPGRSKPITDTSPSTYLNLDMGMQKSSNIYMGRLAELMVNRFGNDWYRQKLQNLFGVGLKTSVELPAESAGVLPTPGKCHPNGTLEWSKPTPFSLAMGHNLQVTSLQILRAYSVLANGGYLITPTIVKKIVKTDRDGTEIILLDHENPERVKKFPKVLNDAIVKRVVHSMRFVTKTGGTAVKADIPGFTEVGKTSTAKKIINGNYSERLYVATFAGFTPADHPAFVLVVTMDEPEYGYIPGIGKNHNGGNCTAGVFREISKRSLEYLGITPDDPFGYPAGDPRRNLEKANWTMENRKLQEIYNTWNKVPEKSKK
jgi:cell division protein FtsI (penicillin-binding protein 3)